MSLRKSKLQNFINPKLGYPCQMRLVRRPGLNLIGGLDATLTTITNHAIFDTHSLAQTTRGYHIVHWQTNQFRPFRILGSDQTMTKVKSKECRPIILKTLPPVSESRAGMILSGYPSNLTMLGRIAWYDVRRSQCQHFPDAAMRRGKLLPGAWSLTRKQVVSSIV